MKAMMEDLGMHTKIKVNTDATTAIGIAMRKGLGPVRHIETNTLWVQEEVYRKEIQVEKVGGKWNIADAITKPADATDLAIRVTGINLEVRRGRHGEAPQMAGEEAVAKVSWADQTENEYGDE